MEFADKLLPYRDDRGPLLEAVHDICNSLGITYLRNDQFSDDSSGPLRDICPFTTIGAFNRGITDFNRHEVADHLGRFLEVNEPAPDAFDSIPTLNNQRSWFFRWAKDRDIGDIDLLWRVFADAIELADSGIEQARQSFEDSYNLALGLPLVSRNLTMGLFWIRPRKYPTLDGKSAQYIAGSLRFRLPGQIPPPGREYLELADGLKERFDAVESPVHSFQELSLAAYEPTSNGSNSSVWLVRAGREGEFEDAALDQGLAIVDWGVADLTSATGTDAVRERVRQSDSDGSNQRVGNITSQLTSFLLDMSEGDIVVLPLMTRRGRVALGRITGPYTYQEVGHGQFHTRPVNWIRTDVPRPDFGEDLQSSLDNPKTIFHIQSDEAERRIAAMLDVSRDPNIAGFGAAVSDNTPKQAPLKPAEVREYTLDDLLADGCFLERSALVRILNRLKMKKNLILQGPPGTGKTWLAKKLAFAMIECKDERRVRRFQFHPNMSYEDFIRGFRPEIDGKLALVDGPFLELIRDARRDLSNDYVMVIEEINRGNPAQIFGEMLTLLEADKRFPDEALRLGQSKSDGERVHVPPNVYVIGTMNVADRSIALVDLALRRRFAFVDLEPTLGAVWRNWVHEQSDVALDFLTTVEARMATLNDRITNDRSLGPQFRVGHSYVTPVPGTPIDDPAEWFRQVVETEIGPLLDEYWFDNSSEAENAKSELLNDL